MVTVQPRIFLHDIGADDRSHLLRMLNDRAVGVRVSGLLGMIGELNKQVREGKLTKFEAGAIAKEQQHLC